MKEGHGKGDDGRCMGLPVSLRAKDTDQHLLLN